MMGRSHVAAGWVVGLAAAHLFGLHGAAEVPFAACVAGFALTPDLDHTGATVSRSLGWFTEAPSRGLRWLSAHVYHATMGPRDEHWSGKHRHLSHTAVFAALLGLLTWWGVTAGGVWVAAAVFTVGLLLAVDGLGHGGITDLFVLVLLGSGVLWWVASGSMLVVLVSMSGWIGWAVFLGCMAHNWADSCTEMGCPWLWPIPWAGETWAEIRFLGPISLHTGHWAEKYLAFPGFVVAGVLLAPGVWPQVVAVAHAFQG